MSYNVTCSTEILTLVSAPFLFISVGILSELGYGVSCVHFTAPLGRKGALFLLGGHMYTSGSTFIKRFKPLSATILL